MVAHGGSLWVVGGSRRNGAVYFNDVWRSADGADWVEVTVSGTKFAGREGHQMVSYGGSLWVVGGHVGGRDRSRYFDDVWRSADGAVWVEVPVSVPVSVSVSVSVTVSVTVSTAFAERSEHQMIAYGGSLWVVGGYDGRDYFDDVWRSADGAVWVEVPVDGEAFAGRSEHQMVSHDGLLWVIGGYDGGFFNDVWYSSDGRRWDSVPAAGARFKPQLGHQVVAHSPSFIYEVAEIVATVKAPRSVSSNSALPLTVATVVATGGSGALWFEVAADAKGVARIGADSGAVALTAFAVGNATVSIRVGDATEVNRTTVAVLITFVPPMALVATSVEYLVSPGFVGSLHSPGVTGGFGKYSFERVDGGCGLTVGARSGVVSLVATLAAEAQATAVFVVADEIGGTVVVYGEGAGGGDAVL